MERKQFIKQLIGTSIAMTMDDLATFANAVTLQNAVQLESSDEIASFGAIHLNNTSIERAVGFWTKVVGMKLRSRSETQAEFGSENKTIVVVHHTANSGFQEGYSGLYHFAIHLSDQQEFAKAIYRLQQNKYPFSPIDHTMTKSLYLRDQDNVMVELALETPERFKKVITEGGLFMQDTDGTIRSASAPLDIHEAMSSLTDKELSVVISDEAKIGHIHFYARDVQLNNEFYKKLGFSQFNFFPMYKYADLGAGGIYQHRVAMNSWHGIDKPLAPIDNAGLKYYHIAFNSKKQFLDAVNSIENAQEKDGNFWVTDPTGIKIKLSCV